MIERNCIAIMMGGGGQDFSCKKKIKKKNSRILLQFSLTFSRESACLQGKKKFPNQEIPYGKTFSGKK